jgi:hypothetical protein
VSDVYVVGGGPSLKGFDFKRLSDKTTIAINQAVRVVPSPNYFITMDSIFSDTNKAFLSKLKETEKVYVANIFNPCLERKNRGIRDLRYGDLDLEVYDRVISSPRESGLSLEWSGFRNGRNSGTCALQLAVLLGFRRIHLLGIDLACGKEETHFHNAYNKVMKNIFRERVFDYLCHWQVALCDLRFQKEIRVFSYSPTCPLNDLMESRNLEDIK